MGNSRLSHPEAPTHACLPMACFIIRKADYCDIEVAGKRSMVKKTHKEYNGDTVKEII